MFLFVLDYDYDYGTRRDNSLSRDSEVNPAELDDKDSNYSPVRYHTVQFAKQKLWCSPNECYSARPLVVQSVRWASLYQPLTSITKLECTFLI